MICYVPDNACTWSAAGHKKNAENGPENTAGQTTNKAFAAVASHAASTMQKRDAVYQLHRMPLH